MIDKMSQIKLEPDRPDVTYMNIDRQDVTDKTDTERQDVIDKMNTDRQDIADKINTDRCHRKNEY